jgi:hypothetical protein
MRIWKRVSLFVMKLSQLRAVFASKSGVGMMILIREEALQVLQEYVNVIRLFQFFAMLA